MCHLEEPVSFIAVVNEPPGDFKLENEIEIGVTSTELCAKEVSHFLTQFFVT